MNPDKNAQMHNMTFPQPRYMISHVPPAAFESDGAILTSTLVPVMQYSMITMVRPKEPKEEAPNVTKTESMSRKEAAIKIQKLYRKYSYKKLFVDREINPVIRYHHTDVYFTALIIKEVVADFVQDFIIEGSDGIYLSIKNSRNYKILWTSYHLLQDEIYKTIYETLDEIMVKENLSMGLIKDCSQFGISSWVSEAISLEIDATIKQFIEETVTSFMEKQRNEAILDMLLYEILLDMDLVGASMEGVVIFDFIEGMLDMETLILVQNLLFDLSLETQLLVYTRPRSSPKSTKVDLVMDNMLDMILFDQILQFKVNDQIYGLENKMNHILDSILATVIIHQISK